MLGVDLRLSCHPLGKAPPFFSFFSLLLFQEGEGGPERGK